LKGEGKKRVKNPDVAVRTALEQSEDVLNLNPVYADKVSRHLTNQAHVFTEKAIDILEVV